ncbi:tetratricopeptide repeat protein 39C-like [Hetaerina americana]|uniref:tetratricopeptide repeat protein 39C-like n=1 Tax=Hetaerina americana TaxID=62018 RepID=UPI003A7F58A1
MQATEEENDWILAKKGIKLLLNNKIEEAEGLFSTHKDNIQMAAGYCFVTFMNALMSFEEEKLQVSLQTLRDMEKRCANDIGWLKVMRNKVFGSSNSNRNAAEHLEQQIILADSQVCVALLTFLQQDLSGYVKGGWVLRKAWKVYQHTYTQILQLYRTTCNNTEDVPGSQFPSWKVILKRPSNPNLLSPTDWSVPSNGCSSATSPTTPTSPLSGGMNGLRSPLSLFSSFGFQAEPSNDIPPSVVSRLMAAVSFGYGIFQLCISLLPPSLLRLIHFLGFEGDRQVGISALMFARQGQDMRAPLATLALLWYHTIVRPFFALDGSNVRAGVEAAQQLIEESQEEYGSSALFLFFKGRVERLKSNVSGALEAYEAAVQASAQREVQLLCLHEVGWCHLIHLSWQPAHTSFLRLRQESRWSKSFYAYLASICAGASGNLDEALSLAHEVPNLATQQRSTQLETFILRRVQRFPDPQNTVEYENDQKVTIDQHQCTLLAFELLFLWNALPSCSPEGLNYILQECDESSREPMQGLSQLLKGATWCCQRRPEEAAVCFRTCLVQRGALPGRSNGNEDDEENIVEEPQEDRHITAFALYELGTLLSKHSETVEEGKCLLLQAQTNYSGYDFENRLNVRIHAALRNIG